METRLEDILEHYPEVTGIHPACLAVPPIGDEDRTALEDSIRNGGLSHAIILTEDGQLIDGRNRLIACYKADVEPRFRKVATDPWQVAEDENIARRHLSTGQRAMFAVAKLDHEKAMAKQRQGQRTDLRKLEQIVEVDTPESAVKQHLGNIAQKSEVIRSRDKVAARVGVSGRSVDKAAKVAEEAPELIDQVKSGEVSLERAHKEASKRQKERESQPVENHQPAAPAKPKAAEPETTTIVTAKGVETQIALPAKVVFNRTNDSVDWASWTWNPVTGCEHGCNFCYAREIAHSDRMRDYYPNQFEPTFHPYRLEAPANTRRPDSDDARDGRVFVCSMADLFGKWVPDEWIERVFASCLESPEWEYLFLTKWPARYSRMPLLERAWYGASVIKQSDVSRVESGMSDIGGPGVTRWISLEPMLEPITFNDLSWCDLVVIGSQTSTRQPDGFVPSFAPEFDWVRRVANQCEDFGVPCYGKANLLTNPGMNLPKPNPRVRQQQEV
jgi:protein gp37/uncharacterized protein GlcG (DUF336 family)